jgi:hypothetical protein
MTSHARFPCPILRDHPVYMRDPHLAARQAFEIASLVVHQVGHKHVEGNMMVSSEDIAQRPDISTPGALLVEEGVLDKFPGHCRQAENLVDRTKA